MSDGKSPKVVLSSTFNDLERHREVVSKILRQCGMQVVRMEDDGTRSDRDVIDSSIAKVDEADAYFCVLGKRYGSIRPCPERNPEGLSTTALEFQRAQERGIPITGLIFGRRYPVGDDENEWDPEKRGKLEALRTAVNQHVVAVTVESEQEFREAAPIAAHDLYRVMRDRIRGDGTPSSDPGTLTKDELPPPTPALYMVRPFAQGTEFVGRVRELDRITEWARTDMPMMVVEAIGGMGKSMLTHRWVTSHAPETLPDVAGRLWYSFYEEGASMRDFCQYALAYMQGCPVETLRKINARDLADKLVAQLSSRSWFLVMDGLERVLLAYGRFDSAHMPDEEADRQGRRGEDQNLCIRPEDDDLLRALASARPSKLLISTRNFPTALLGPSKQPLAGVVRETLEGLTTEDAERMMREAGILGDGDEIRRYLGEHFGCHPLVIAVVAGLVREHAPAPCDFDHWLIDPLGAREVDLASLDGLVGKRKHVLKVAYEGLEPDARQLLGRIAFFSHSVEFEVLETLNPRRSAPPEEAPEAGATESYGRPFKQRRLEQELRTTDESGRKMKLQTEIEALKLEAEEAHRRASQARQTFLSDLAAWKASPELHAAKVWLRKALLTLQRCGLLVRDPTAIAYDLHPLVRAFLRDVMSDAGRAEVGQVVADYARAKAPETLSDNASAAQVDAYLELARVLVLGGHMESVAELLAKNLMSVFQRTGRVSASYQLIRPLFGEAIQNLHPGVSAEHRRILSNQLGVAADRLGLMHESKAAHTVDLMENLRSRLLSQVHTSLTNLSISMRYLGKTAYAVRLLNLARAVAQAVDTPYVLSDHDYKLTVTMANLGNLAWRRYAPRARLDEPSSFEGTTYMIPWVVDARFQVDRWSGTLKLEELDKHLRTAQVQGDVDSQRYCLTTKALWLQQSEEHHQALEAFQQAIKLGRECSLPTARDEAKYAISLVRTGRLNEARTIAANLSMAREPPYLPLAELWLALGETEKARDAALTAYPKAWADGPPLAFHWELRDCRAVLKAVNEPEPKLPTTRPEDLPPFPFEEDIHRLIAEHKAEQSGDD